MWVSIILFSSFFRCLLACVNELRPENQDAGELVRSMISNSDSPGLGIDTDLEGELAEALRILWADPGNFFFSFDGSNKCEF